MNSFQRELKEEEIESFEVIVIFLKTTLEIYEADIKKMKKELEIGAKQDEQ